MTLTQILIIAIWTGAYALVGKWLLKKMYEEDQKQQGRRTV